ncbi:MAG TPA: hypothetical protein VM431_09865 [Phycisphaerae bacterium]|nr:hypothetical protein [Phycisphaerae bacterium]
MPDPHPTAMRYQHTQPAHVIRVAMALALAPMLLVMVLVPNAENVPGSTLAILVGVAVILAATTALFWSMTITVTDDELVWHFGPGVIRKRVPLADVASCQPTRTSFWNGWGIHWSPRGWVYNVSGFGAVDVRLISGKALRLGTDEPEALAEAIRDALGHQRG